MEILEGPNKADIKKEETKGFKTPAKDIKKKETKGIKTPAKDIGSHTQDPETVWMSYIQQET